MCKRKSLQGPGRGRQAARRDPGMRSPQGVAGGRAARAGGPAPRDGAGLGGCAHAGLGSPPRSTPGRPRCAAGKPVGDPGTDARDRAARGNHLGKDTRSPPPVPSQGAGLPWVSPRAAGGFGLRRARGGDPPPPHRPPGAAPHFPAPAREPLFRQGPRRPLLAGLDRASLTCSGFLGGRGHADGGGSASIRMLQASVHRPAAPAGLENRT